MICLSDGEAAKWFERIGFSVSSSRALLPFSESSETRNPVWTRAPVGAVKLAAFAQRVVEWLPSGGTKILWLKDWQSSQPFQIQAIERLRGSFGERRAIVEAPGHVFSSTNYDRFDLDTKTPADIEEDGCMTTLLLLLICFDWDFYIAGNTGRRVVRFQDQEILFYAFHGETGDDLHKLRRDFDLSFRS
jgi:hypothetical protein